MRTLSVIVVSVALAGSPTRAHGAYPPGDRWYQNPLAFEPLKLHTANALIVPGLAATAALLLTRSNELTGTRMSFYAQAGGALGYKGPYTTALSQELGAMYHARSWLAIGGELAAYEFRDAWNDTVGVAIRPLIRWYPFHGTRLRVFFESGAGLIFTVREFPARSQYDERIGLRLNGATRYGLGAELRVTPGVLLVAGVRHQHVSNGNVHGTERNPSHDANGVFLGAAWASR